MTKQSMRGRGRPSDLKFSHKDRQILENLAGIAIRHQVNSDIFFDHLVEAWNNKVSQCGPLIVKCRRRMGNSAIFLFTNRAKSMRKVVAQFPISTAILRGENPLGRYTEAILARTVPVRKLVSVASKIGDLKAGMKKVSLKAEVLEVPKAKIVSTKYGTNACVSNTLIRDETGSMKMSLWNNQINMVHKGDLVDVKNCRVAWFGGERQLQLGRSGSLSVIEYARKL